MNFEKLIEQYLKKVNKLSKKAENFFIIKLEYNDENGKIYCQYGYTDAEAVNTFKNHNFLDEVDIQITYTEENQEMKFNIV